MGNETNLDKIIRYQEAEAELLRKRKIASERIEKLIKIDDDFELSVNYLLAIHRVIFKDLFEHSGKLRKDNLMKQERVLNGRSVFYPDYKEVEKCLKYDMKEEKRRKYLKLNEEQKVRRIAKFTSNIWQAHPFREGNTRTVSVFIEKYLIYLGYTVDNHIFKENSRYFRNALVKSTYENYSLGIRADFEPLYNFFRKVMIDETIELDEESVYVVELFRKDEFELVKQRIKKK